MGKAATALVEVSAQGKPLGTGSAFCVHAAGLFVTNRHMLLTRRPRSTRDDMRKIPLVKRATPVLSPTARLVGLCQRIGFSWRIRSRVSRSLTGVRMSLTTRRS